MIGSASDLAAVLHHRARRLRLRAAGRRRLLAAAFASVAVLLVAAAMRPAHESHILAAQHDLAPGTVLTARDVRDLAMPADAVPAGALHPGEPLHGRTVASAVRRGEALTDVRLVGRPLLTALGSGSVAVAVPPADPAVAALLQPGDRVDVLAVPANPESSASTDAPARTLVSAALVLAVPQPGAPTGGSGSLGGALLGSTSSSSSSGSATGRPPSLLLAIPRPLATTVAGAATAAPLPVLLTGPAPDPVGP